MGKNVCLKIYALWFFSMAGSQNADVVGRDNAVDLAGLHDVGQYKPNVPTKIWTLKPREVKSHWTVLSGEMS